MEIEKLKVLSSPKHALHPRDHFVTRWVRGLVEIYDTGADVRLKVALEWGASIGNGSEMASSDKY
jgi:hypothetical protein